MRTNGNGKITYKNALEGSGEIPEVEHKFQEISSLFIRLILPIKLLECKESLQILK